MKLNELQLIYDFLEELNERFGTDGCNDFIIPRTPQNIELIRNIDKNFIVDLNKDCIYTTNFLVVEYLMEKLKEEINKIPIGSSLNE